MKRKDKEQLKEKSAETLRKMISELKIEIADKRAKIYVGQEKNVKGVRNDRRKLAIMKTLIREKELGEEVQNVQEVRKVRKERRVQV